MRKTVVFLFIFTLFFSLSLAAETTQITSFNDLMAVLNSGHEVRVVIHYGVCTLISNNEEKSYSPNAIGGMSIEVYEYFPAGLFGNKNAYVVLSESKLIENPIGEGYVYNYVKIKISDDEKVRIIARYLDPQTYKEVMDESFYTSIKTVENDGGVNLYID